MCVYAFSICATALGKRPPAPPYHTVQVTILRATTTTTTTTTAQITMHAFSICGTALEKRPPPLPSHSASYNITANHHRHYLDHHSTSYNACIQYMRHCFRKKTDHQCKLLWAWSSTSTLQTTACAKEYLRTVVYIYIYIYRTYSLPAHQGCQSTQTITLHYITLDYITLHYITLHYIILLYITMVYCNLPCIYIFIYICYSYIMAERVFNLST